MASLAKRFWAFGLSFGVGALLGYFASFLMMGHFYDFRNEKGILPEITIHFHWQLLLAWWCYQRPSLCFSRLVMLEDNSKPRHFAYWKNLQVRSRSKGERGTQERQIFLKRAVFVTDLGEKIYLVFCGLWLHVFCGHGSIVLWLRDYTDDIIQTMMIMIGLILSFSILFLSLGIVVSESRETLALMKLLDIPIVNAKVIFSPPIVFGPI